MPAVGISVYRSCRWEQGRTPGAAPRPAQHGLETRVQGRVAGWLPCPEERGQEARTGLGPKRASFCCCYWWQRGAHLLLLPRTPVPPLNKVASSLASPCPRSKWVRLAPGLPVPCLPRRSFPRIYSVSPFQLQSGRPRQRRDRREPSVYHLLTGLLPTPRSLLSLLSWSLFLSNLQDEFPGSHLRSCLGFLHLWVPGLVPGLSLEGGHGK